MQLREKSYMIQKLVPRGGQVIGITGNICSGKSFALKYLNKRGFKTISMDSLVHKAMREDNHIIQKISEVFPQALKDRNICRISLGNIVFNNRLMIKKLESIIHPYTRNKIKYLSEMTRYRKSRSIVIESPLLFEKKREKYFDFIICLFSSQEIMLKRALSRKNMNKEKFCAILNNQMTLEKKIHKADYLICNHNRFHVFQSLNKIIINDRFKRNCSRY